MAIYGVTASGFVKKTFDQIKADLQTAYQNIYGNPNLADDSVFGQEIGVKAAVLADLWELAEAVYQSYDPDSAAGAALDNVLSLCLLSRLPAVYTEVVCTISGTPGTSIASGKQIQSTNSDVFALQTTVVIGGGGTISGTFVAVVAGPIAADVGTLIKIVTPVSGWNTVTNPAAGTVGRVQESDAQARLRRILSLQINGAATVASLQSAIINDVANVSLCMVYENETDVVDVNGLPPHSIHVVVLGGLDSAIANTIFQKKAAGIQTFGADSQDVVDTNGNSHTIFFSRPTNKYVWVEVTINAFYSKETFPTDGYTQIKNAVVEYGKTLVMGEELILQRWYGPVFSVPGLMDISLRQAITDNPGDTPSFVAADIPLTAIMLPQMDVARVTVLP